MKAAMAGVNVSPVNMEDRKALGIKAGDTVKVHQKIVDEKGKTRIQVFEGLVLARKHGTEPGATFTVRKVASGVGVEKIYPLYSPLIDKIEIVRRAKVRRAKLYYIREKVNREIKRQMRRMSFVSLATESEAETAQRAADEAKQAEEAAAKQAEEEAAKQAEADAKAAEEAAATPEATEPTEPAAETPVEEAAPAAAETPADSTESPVEAEQAEVMEEKLEEAKEEEAKEETEEKKS